MGHAYPECAPQRCQSEADSVEGRIAQVKETRFREQKVFNQPGHSSSNIIQRRVGNDKRCICELRNDIWLFGKISLQRIQRMKSNLGWLLSIKVLIYLLDNWTKRHKPLPLWGLHSSMGNKQWSEVSVISESETPWTVAHQRPLSMEFSGKNTGVGSRSLLQGIFLTQGSNPGLLNCRQILYFLSHHVY